MPHPGKVLGRLFRVRVSAGFKTYEVTFGVRDPWYEQRLSSSRYSSTAPNGWNLVNRATSSRQVSFFLGQLPTRPPPNRTLVSDIKDSSRFLLDWV